MRTSKPWEEDWAAVYVETYGRNELHHGPGQIRCTPWGHDEEDFEELRLVAQAPAMARLLVKIRSSYVPGDEEADEIESVLRAAGALDALPDWCRPRNAG